jgi:hypothetical protein
MLKNPQSHILLAVAMLRATITPKPHIAVLQPQASFSDTGIRQSLEYTAPTGRIRLIN